jgi:hypothetical protein
MTMTLAMNPHFELHVRPSLAFVSVVRRFVEELTKRFLSPDDASRIALATHELLENAVKFSTDGATTIRMEIDAALVRVVVRNRAARRHIDAVQALLAGIAESANPDDFYQALFVKRARVRDGSGGLGLARICAEAEMELTCRVTDDELELDATSAILTGGATCSKY